MQRPEGLSGMRHVALNVKNLEGCERFYRDLLGMRVEWRPDADNVYLTSGADNLALHRIKGDFAPVAARHLDHIGFILDAIERVDEWHAYLRDSGVKILKAPRTHRDGARSFYCQDPDGNTVQMIYHPPISTKP